MMIREPGQQMDALGTSKEFVNVDFVPWPTLWDGITRMYIYRPILCRLRTLRLRPWQAYLNVEIL